MRNRRSTAAIGTAVLMGGSALILSAQAPAIADASEPFESSDLVGTVDPAIVAAMERDFDLTTEEVFDRLETEAAALEVQRLAADTLGSAYAGTWVTDDGIVVASTESRPALAADVDTALVDQTLRELETYAADIAAAVERLGEADDVYSWYVDVPANSVAIVAADEAAADRVASAAGVAAGAYVVEVEAAAPIPYQQIRGGDAYNIAGASRCSVGFSATHPAYGDGFLTAGHCDIGSGQITGGTGAGGQFRFSQFPGEDWAWVEAGPGWEVAPLVNRYGGADVQVTDGNEAAIGASVCRSGSTTGWYCGVIEAKGVTINYQEGAVRGMTRTTVCAEPGDSGGSYISGGSAQGTTSGGAGTCPSGWTVFEPLSRALARTGAVLTTTGGQEPPQGFGVSLSPSARTVEPGQSTSVTVSTQTTSGSPQQVTLSASGAPSGVTVSISPNQVTTGQSATLNVSTTAGATEGTHTITVTAQGSVTRTATLTLTIGDGGGNEGTWQAGVAYSVGDQVTYDGVGYVCRIAHTSQSSWTPDVTPALWGRL